jgi:hypothetical protein
VPHPFTPKDYPDPLSSIIQDSLTKFQSQQTAPSIEEGSLSSRSSDGKLKAEL